MSDFFDDEPPEAMDQGQAPAPQNIEIKTANSNLGAVRVAVPRHMSSVLKAIDECAQQFGHSWLYSIPFKEKQQDGSYETKFREGPTIGCTLDVARCYGNCNVDCDRIEEVGGNWIFHAVFLDIETGFRITRPFHQRKQQNIGGMGGDRGRAEDIIFQIGASKAMRNVTRNALRGLIDEALRRGSKRLTDRIKNNRPGVIEKIKSRCAENNIPNTRIQAYYQKPMDDLEPHELASLIKQFQGLAEGLIDADQICPEPAKASPKVADHEPKDGREVLDVGELTDEDLEKIKTSEVPSGAPVFDDEDQKPAKRKVIKLHFRGKEYTKTAYLRDIKQMTKACESLGDLAELANCHASAMDTVEYYDDQLAIGLEARTAIERARKRMLERMEEEDNAMDVNDPAIDHAIAHDEDGVVSTEPPKDFDNLV